jgi:hypothetical protein
MNERPVTDAMARQFLLGKVNDSERERIERLCLSDLQVKETMSLIEDDLVDEFLEGDLSPDDRERFLAQYAATPRQRRKLRIAKSIKEHAVVIEKSGETTTTSFAGRFYERWPINLKLSVALTVATIIVLIGAVWLIRFSVQRTQESNRRLNIEREIAELNARSGRQENPEGVLSAVLRPGSVRAIERENALRPKVDTKIIELSLLWTQTEKYPSYQAIIRRHGDSEAFTIADLHLENDRNGTAIRLLLPVRLLTNGVYRISLSGVPTNGVPAFPEEYSFTIDRNQ